GRDRYSGRPGTPGRPAPRLPWTGSPPWVGGPGAMVTFPGPGLFPRRIAGHHGDRDRAPPGAAADPTSASTGGHPVIRGPHRGGNEPTTSPGGDMTSLGYRRPLSRRQRVWALVPALLLL